MAKHKILLRASCAFKMQLNRSKGGVKVGVALLHILNNRRARMCGGLVPCGCSHRRQTRQVEVAEEHAKGGQGVGLRWGELEAGLRGLPTCVYEHAGQTFETPLSKWQLPANIYKTAYTLIGIKYIHIHIYTHIRICTYIDIERGQRQKRSICNRIWICILSAHRSRSVN